MKGEVGGDCQNDCLMGKEEMRRYDAESADDRVASQSVKELNDQPLIPCSILDPVIESPSSLFLSLFSVALSLVRVLFFIDLIIFCRRLLGSALLLRPRPYLGACR